MAARRGRKKKTTQTAWQAPEGWGRLVVWMSPEERRSLKLSAADADVTVAELVRSLATSLESGVVAVDELLSQHRKGDQVMQKIPTIFDRNESFKVTDRVRKGCEWVFEGQGVATEKLDGTNIRLTIRSGTVVRVEKRRNPTKVQKQQGIMDGWYVDADSHAKEDKWVFEAVASTDVSKWPDGEHSSEALGPKIQGNPLKLDRHLVVPFDLEVPIYDNTPRTFEGLKTYLGQLESQFHPGALAEGIVFHHADGRRAKIKRKDFGLN